MLKKLITALLLFASLSAFSQTAPQTVYTSAPAGSTSYTPTARYKGSNTDSLLMQAFFSNGSWFWQMYTGAQSNARFVQLGGSYANPSWITSLAYSKLTGAPTIGTTTNPLTVNNSGTGDASSFIFNGAVARTLSWNSIGAQPQLSGTGFVKASGTTISYDNSTYLTTSSAASTYQTLANLQTTLTNSATLYPSGSAVTAAIAAISSPTGANPTASVGVTAVNGSASTFMRSDAAPKGDTSLFQTVLNFFPKGDTRYAKKLVFTAIKTANYTLVPNDYAIGNATAGTFTFTLPNTPADGTVIGVKMVNTSGTNVISLATQGSDVFNGGGTSASLALNFQAITFQYKLSNNTWYSVSTNLALGQLDARYQGALTLTTTGSGAATLVSNVLNIPTSGGTVTGGSNGLSASGANIIEGGTLTQNTNQTNGGFYHRRDSTILGTRTAYTTPSGHIYVWGSSIAAGSTPSGVTPWPTTLGALMGLTVVNNAGSGNTVENRSPSGVEGGVSLLTQTGTIPTYSGVTGTTNIVVIDPGGPNDWQCGYTNYNTTNYNTDLTTWLNAFISAGWPSANVYVLNNSYVNPSKYGTTGPGGNTITQAGYIAFKALTKSITLGLGMHFIDVDAAFTNGLNIQYLAPSDAVHPSQIGQTFEGYYVYSQITNGAVNVVQPGTQYGAVQNATVNGPLAASYLNIGSPIQLTNSTTNKILGRNDKGDVGVLQTLPYKTILGAVTYWNGHQIAFDTDTTNVTWANKNDMAGGTFNINSVYPSNNAIIGTLGFNANGLADLQYKQVGYTNATGNMFGLVSTTGNAFLVNQRGDGTFLRSVTAGSTGFIGQYNGVGLTAASGSNSGTINPFASDLAGAGSWTGIINYIGAGGFEFKSAPSVLGTYVERMKIDNLTGNMTIGVPSYNTGTTAAASGNSLEVSGTARTDGNAYFGVVGPPTGSITATPSTTGGLLAAGAKFYVLTTLDAGGNESNKSAEVSCTTTGSTGSVSVAFTNVTNGQNYRLYQSATTGTEAHYVTGTFTGTPIVDVGTYTAGSPPTAGVNKTYLSSISGTTGAAAFTALTVNGSTTPTIKAANRLTAQTAAAGLSAYTVGASDGSFIISSNVLVTASTTHSFSITCTYTDEGNTSRTLTLNVSQLTGAFITAITNVTGASAYEGVPVHIRAKAGSTITLATAGTFTSVTYNFEGVIQQVN